MPAAQSPKGQAISKVAPTSVALAVTVLDRTTEAAVARKRLLMAESGKWLKTTVRTGAAALPTGGARRPLHAPVI
uniref:hypothetical protein n=1 Tax=Rhizobium sp. F40D2 TaxID=3453141 RepID=UPI003F2226F6